MAYRSHDESKKKPQRDIWLLKSVSGNFPNLPSKVTQLLSTMTEDVLELDCVNNPDWEQTARNWSERRQSFKASSGNTNILQRLVEIAGNAMMRIEPRGDWYYFLA